MEKKKASALTHDHSEDPSTTVLRDNRLIGMILQIRGDRGNGIARDRRTSEHGQRVLSRPKLLQQNMGTRIAITPLDGNNI